MRSVPGMIRVMAAVPRDYLASPEKNAQEIAALLQKADEEGAELAVFPELCLCGYTVGDLVSHPALLEGCKKALKTLMELKTRCAFVVGLPLDMTGRLFNCAAVVAGGKLVGIVPKTHLPNAGEFCERRWFDPGRKAPQSTTLFGQTVPVGSCIFDCGRFSFGVEICEDLWVPAPPSSVLCPAGALFMANLSASNELVTKHRTRTAMIAQQSTRCRCGYIYASAGYGESTTDLVFSGYAGIYEGGKRIAENERFARQSNYVLADLDAQGLRFKRRRIHSYEPPYAPEVRTIPFELPAPDGGAVGGSLPGVSPDFPAGGGLRSALCYFAAV